MSLMDVPKYPFLANSSSAASKIRSFVSPAIFVPFRASNRSVTLSIVTERLLVNYFPIFLAELISLQENGKDLLALEISPGRSTPYYYKADGMMEAYIRIGNESVIAPDYI